VLVEGREVATLGPGDVFGEMGLMCPTGRTADVRSATYCELWSLAGHDLHQARAPPRTARPRAWIATGGRAPSHALCVGPTR
jgi:CRP-like cAMP-binding protein